MAEAPVHRLLVLACSSRKRATAPGRLLPAWDLYDGQLFRVCKRIQREGRWPTGLVVLILSAEHGLIAPDQPISWYDRRMTAARADEIRSETATRLAAASLHRPLREVFLALGSTYARAVTDAFPTGVRVVDGSGTIGRMQARLRDWITEPQPP